MVEERGVEREHAAKEVGRVRGKEQDGPPPDTAKAAESTTENPPTENVDDQTGCSHAPTIDVDAAEVPTQQRSSRLRRKKSRLAGETSKLKRLKVMSPSSSAKKSRSRQGDPGDADDKAVGPGEQSVPGELVGLNHEPLEKPKRKKRKSKSKSRLGKPCKTDKPQDTEEVQALEAQEVPIPPSPMDTEPDVETAEHEKKKAEEKAKVEQAAKDLVFLNKSLLSHILFEWHALSHII